MINQTKCYFKRYSLLTFKICIINFILEWFAAETVLWSSLDLEVTWPRVPYNWRAVDKPSFIPGFQGLSTAFLGLFEIAKPPPSLVRIRKGHMGYNSQDPKFQIISLVRPGKQRQEVSDEGKRVSFCPRGLPEIVTDCRGWQTGGF